MIYEKLHQDIKAIKCSSNIDDAIYNHVISQIDFFEKNKFLSKLISEYKKYLISIKISAILKSSSSSFTKSNLQIFTSDKQLATPNRTSAIIDTAIHLGFLISKPSINDRRHNILSATEKFYKIKDEQIDRNKKILNLMFSNIKFDSTTKSASISENYLDIYFRTSLLYRPKSALYVFLKREAGYPILLKILQATRHCSHHNKVISLPFSHLSRSFGVSRAHVQKMLQAADDAKLIRLQTTGGKEIEVLPRLEKLSKNMIILSLAIIKGAIDQAQTQSLSNDIETETAMMPSLLAVPSSDSASIPVR